MTAVPAPPPAPAPEQQWRENEDGPECSCGNPTVVKLMPDGSAALLCLFHTSEAALFTSLPAERPAGWPARAAIAPAPEAATPDPVAATVAALVELAHNRNGASRIAREGISGRSQERACQLEGEAIGLDAAAELIRRRLAPAWDALAARLAEAEAERDKAQRATRLLAKIVSDDAYVMEAARIEMFHGDPYAATQWILNAKPDQWDDRETAWDGTETAQAWFDRARAVLEARDAPEAPDAG